MSRVARGSGQGKVILLGEHAVVHGVPALALGLDRSIEVTLGGPPGAETPLDARARAAFRQMADEVGAGDVAPSVRSQLPAGAGLGSSAAFSVAAARALLAWVGRPDDPDGVLWLAGIGEAVFHGNPSGIDAAVAAFGGLLRFERGSPPAVTPLPAPPGGVPLVIADTGQRAPTRDLVEAVGRLHRKNRVAVGALFDIVAALVGTAPTFLETADWPALGRSFDACHSILGRLGVSTERLDQGCRIARAAGATGAKLTGAGGGGCLLALVPTDAARTSVEAALRGAGYDLV